METAILVVGAVILLAVTASYLKLRSEQRALLDLLRHITSMQNEWFGHATAEHEETIALCSEIRDVLVKASTLKAAKDSPFDSRDKIPATGSRRYVTVAMRRAAAESAAAVPQTHKDQVRENNARVFGSV